MIYRKLATAVALMALTGCESTSEQRFDSYEPARQAYFKCGFQAGGYIRKQRQGIDPLTLENSAKALCGQERSTMIGGIIKAHGSAAWTSIIATFDQKFSEMVSLGSIKS